jgi:Tfp pilus assembly protein PilX
VRKHLLPPDNPRGFALVVVLLLLTALSLLGVASLRSVALQEKMAGNLYFKHLVFQDAESALRSTAARMDSLLGPTAAVGATPSATSINFREFNSSASNVNYLIQNSNWTGTRAFVSLARTSVNVNAITDSLGVQEVQGCQINTGPNPCKLAFTRMSARSIDPGTGAAAVVQQYWAFPAK